MEAAHYLHLTSYCPWYRYLIAENVIERAASTESSVSLAIGRGIG